MVFEPVSAMALISVRTITIVPLKFLFARLEIYFLTIYIRHLQLCFLIGDIVTFKTFSIKE